LSRAPGLGEIVEQFADLVDFGERESRPGLSRFEHLAATVPKWWPSVERSRATRPSRIAGGRSFERHLHEHGYRCARRAAPAATSLSGSDL
jgi:hypothetical protein